MIGIVRGGIIGALLMLGGQSNGSFGGGGSSAPTTCANTNNYPCLNTANAFTALNTVTSAADAAALVVTSANTGANGVLAIRTSSASGFGALSFQSSGGTPLGYIGYFAGGGNAFVFNTLSNQNISVSAGSGTIDLQSNVTALKLGSETNCSSAAAPAVCGSSPSGSVAVAAAATTVVVNTTAVTANSQIQLTQDSSLGTKLSVTCNTTANLAFVSARSAGTSFTITSTAPITNPLCLSYTIVN